MILEYFVIWSCVFSNSGTVLRLLLCCSLLKTQHTGKTHRELQRQRGILFLSGDSALPDSQYCIYSFDLEGTWGPLLFAVLWNSSPHYSPGAFSSAAIPGCATPGQEGPVTTMVITNACSGFTATCKRQLCEVSGSREYSPPSLISYNYYLPKDQFAGCRCFEVRHLESLRTWAKL